MGFFFFKQKTADDMRISDWSSDVCSSDLRQVGVSTDLNDALSWKHAEGACRPFRCMIRNLMQCQTSFVHRVQQQRHELLRAGHTEWNGEGVLPPGLDVRARVGRMLQNQEVRDAVGDALPGGRRAVRPIVRWKEVRVGKV